MKRFVWITGLVVLLGAVMFVYIDRGRSFVKLMMKMEGNYRPPQYENDSTILAEVLKKNVYYDRLYCLNGMQSLNELKAHNVSDIPFLHIYDRNKIPLVQVSGSECSWSLINFFAKGDSSQLMKGDSTLYSFIVERLKPIDIKKDQDTFDYYVMAGWVNFAPKFADSLFAETNRLQLNGGRNICISYINFDQQEDWKL